MESEQLESLLRETLAKSISNEAKINALMVILGSHLEKVNSPLSENYVERFNALTEKEIRSILLNSDNLQDAYLSYLIKSLLHE